MAHFVEFLELLKHTESKFHASLFNIRPTFPPHCMVKYMKCEVIDHVHSYASGALKAHWDTIGCIQSRGNAEVAAVHAVTRCGTSVSASACNPLRSITPWLQSWVLAVVKTKNRHYAPIRAAQEMKVPEINRIPRSKKIHSAQQEQIPNGKTLQLLKNSFKIFTCLGTWRHGSVTKGA